MRNVFNNVFNIFSTDVEISYSIKVMKPWDDQLLDNATLPYVIFSGKLEQAVSCFTCSVRSPQ